MGIKKDNLDKLLKLGFNVHEYIQITTLDELIKYSEKNKKFSIRFDSEEEKYGLPFYKYDEDNILDTKTYFENIIEEMKKLDCTLICSNGYNYDNNLLFNFVIDVDKDNNFILELCSKKIPLRDMYSYKTTIIKGNIYDNYKNYTIINNNENKYTEKEIKNIINIIIDNDFKLKYIEGTIYDINVGILNNSIIFWQTNKI